VQQALDEELNFRVEMQIRKNRKLGMTAEVERHQPLFLRGHRDLGDGDGVTLHLARQRHSGVTSVHLKQRAVLVGYFVNLTIADEDELTAALDTS
jgi:hypothetical protein